MIACTLRAGSKVASKKKHITEILKINHEINENCYSAVFEVADYRFRLKKNSHFSIQNEGVINWIPPILYANRIEI